MIIARYLNIGQWENTPINLAQIDDKIARNWGDMLLREYAGIDTRGLIKIDIGIGAHIDEFALEQSIDDDFKTYLDPGKMGSKMKSGKVFQLLQTFFCKGGK